MTLRGIDISSANGAIDWTKARAGLSFAMARCVTEISTIDPRYRENIDAIRAANLIGGAYCFLNEGHGAEQADLFIAEIKRTGPRGIVFMLDIERGGGTLPTQADITAFVSKVHNVYPLQPIMIYGSPGVLGALGTLAQYTGAWWEANYPGASGTWDDAYKLAGGDNAAAWQRDACGWTRPLVWQFTSRGTVPGIAGNVDLDACKSPLATMQALAGMVTPDDTIDDAVANAKVVGAQSEWDRQFAKGGAKITPLPRP